MAHMVETLAYAGAKPWHGLGVPVPPDIDVDEMLVRAGLDWTVGKVPLHMVVDGEQLPVLGLARGQLAEFRETAGFLASRRYGQDEVARFFLEVFDPERAANASGADTGVPLPRVAMALDALDTQPGGELAAAAGTWWGAANAVTFLQDHRLGRSAETRLSSSWFGEGRQFKLRALRLAAEYARAA